jgi:hypothetical protein
MEPDQLLILTPSPWDQNHYDPVLLFWVQLDLRKDNASEQEWSADKTIAATI